MLNRGPENRPMPTRSQPHLKNGTVLGLNDQSTDWKSVVRWLSEPNAIESELLFLKQQKKSPAKKIFSGYLNHSFNWQRTVFQHSVEAPARIRQLFGIAPELQAASVCSPMTQHQPELQQLGFAAVQSFPRISVATTLPEQQDCFQGNRRADIQGIQSTFAYAVESGNRPHNRRLEHASDSSQYRAARS